jgi:hypothetical protein
MALSELFSTTYLFSIAIIIILIGGIFAYVSYRMSEQDHKLTTMVNLVSMLAQDLQSVKNKVHLLEAEHPENEEKQDLLYPSQLMSMNGGELIDVSDEDDDEDDEEDEDDEDDEEEDEEDEVEDEEDEEDEVEDEDDEIEDEEDNALKEIHIEKDSNIDIDLGEQILLEEDKHNIKTITLTEHLDIDILANNEQIEDLSFLKNIEMGDDLHSATDKVDNDTTEDYDKANNEKIDYKKMSLNKLREIVTEKGLVADASKLKKHDMLKLLGDE